MLTSANPSDHRTLRPGAMQVNGLHRPPLELDRYLQLLHRRAFFTDPGPAVTRVIQSRTEHGF